VTSQRVDPEEHAPGLPDFLRRHYGAPPHDVFQLTRAVMHDRWAAFGTAGEDVRVVELTLQVTRNARALGTPAAPLRHRPRPAHPPAARSVLAARSFDPGWRHPDPWRLLAADEARPLRALVHLDPLSRDLAVLRWLGVPDAQTAAELGLSEAEMPGRLDEAMRQWAAVVAAATAPGPGPAHDGRRSR
jgi:hypothetical protein